MLRRAVVTLIFGAGIPILALSYMALRSIASEKREDERKAEEQAQTAAKLVRTRLNEQLQHIERSVLGDIRDALKTPENPDEDGDDTPLNAAGRELEASLARLHSTEPLVRQGFILANGKLVSPYVHKAPAAAHADSVEHELVAEVIRRSEIAPPQEASLRLFNTERGCKDEGLKAAILLAEAQLRLREAGGELDDDGFREVVALLDRARADPDWRGVDGESVYYPATLLYGTVAHAHGDAALARNAIAQLLRFEMENRWGEDAQERRRYIELLFDILDKWADETEAFQQIHALKLRARFFEGFEETILGELRARVKPPAPGEPVPFRLGTVAEGEPRLLSAIAALGSVTTIAPVTSGRPAHRNEPYFVAGVDVDFERLQQWAENEISEISTQTAGSVLIAITDRGGTVFAGDVTASKRPTFATAFGEELPGWNVHAAPRDPDAPARSAEKKLEISLALVATCALASLGSFSLALRAASREVEVAKVRTDLVRNVSHELRTPVASIQMLSEMLEEGGLDATKQQEYFGRIAREARRLARLIENVLDLARVERGARKVDPQPLPLADTVDQAVLLFRESEQGREANVVLKDGSGNAVVPLDPAALEQILGNLLSNAVKYSPSGSEVAVECAASERAATIVVRDRGRGMTPDEQRRLFNPFYRARPEDAATTGVGLGLVITRELIRLHKGTLGIDSTLGRGTAFTITLPRETA
jgi:two-component system phosphate regulon sensor histidine kinase PhoR